MKCTFLLLVSCINLLLLSLFVARSVGGVGSPCEDGKFFDQSRKQSIPCHECKKEIQECFLCCKKGSDNQDARGNATGSSQANSHLHPHDTSGQTKHDLSKSNENLPNILVVSIISFFILISLLIPILVIVKRSTRRSREENDQTSNEIQRSGIVTVTMMGSTTDSVSTTTESTRKSSDQSQIDSKTEC